MNHCQCCKCAAQFGQPAGNYGGQNALNTASPQTMGMGLGPQLYGDGVQTLQGAGAAQAPPGGKHTLMKPEVYTGVFQSFPLALEEIARLTIEGSKQQGHYLHGWKEVPDGFKVYSEAHARHVLREAQVEHPDEHLHEVLAVAWNALARAEHLIKKMRKAEVGY